MRFARYCAYAVGALVLLVIAAALLLPELLDRPRIARELQSKLSAAVQGEVRWQEFDLRILPSPRGMLRGLEVKTAAASVSAEEVSASLRLWPLFHGRAEISSVSLARPVLELTVVPAATVPKEARLAPAQDPLQAYRSVVGALVGVLRELAPDTVVEIDNADVSLRIEGLPPAEVSSLGVRARTARDGVEIGATAKSRYWTALKLDGRIRYADLSSTADLQLTRVQGQAWLDWLLRASGIQVAVPDVDLNARFSGDPAKSLALDVDGAAQSLTLTRGAKRIAASPIVLKAKLVADAAEARLELEKLAAGSTSLGGGVLTYGIKDGTVGGELGFHVDLAQALGIARELGPGGLARIESASGALDGRVSPLRQGEAWRVGIVVAQSDAAVQLKGLPGPLRVARGKLQFDDRSVKGEDVALSAPAGSLVAAALYDMKDGAASGSAEFDLDVGQTLALARAALPRESRGALDIVEAASGRARGRAKGQWSGKTWSAGVDIVRSDAQAKLKPLPGPIRLTSASLQADPRIVKADKVALSIPAGNVLVSSARYAMKGDAAAAQVRFDLDVGRTLAFARGLLAPAQRGALDIVESASGRLAGDASAELAGKTWTASLGIAQSSAQAKLKPLPAPLSLDGAALRATQDTLTIERARVRLLDASATLSVALSDYAAPRVRASGAQADIGPKLVDWMWQTASLPSGLEPKAPLRVTVPHIAWAPGPTLELRANAQFDAGATVGVDLTWSPQALDVRRAQIKDRLSDAAVVLRLRGAAIDGSYSGTLDSRTIGSMLKSAAAPAGAIVGELRFVYDHDQPRRTSVTGTLKGERVDLSWLSGVPATLERLELAADGESVQVSEASVDWAGQRATLRGQVARTASGPVVDAEIESPGIDVDALLPKPKADAAPAEKSEKPAQIWPLPVTGRIALRTQLVQYDRYKVAPLRASVTLESERAVLEVNEALVCGLAVPMTLEATPKGYALAAQIAAQKQKLEESAQCLAGEKLMLTGPMDLRVNVRSQGQLAELVRNMKGTVSLDVRNGTVTRFALLGNILSMQNVAALVTQGPQLGRDAFPFRQLAAKGRLDGGYFYLEEGVFHSNAIGLGANGWVSLTDYSTRLTVLVAPLALVDEAVRKLPLLGYVIGGTFTSLPVAVNGDIRDPLVVPLGPGAITNEMMGILTRTFTLPGKVVPGQK